MTAKNRAGQFSWLANQDFAAGFSFESLYGLTATGTTQGTAAFVGNGYSQFTSVPLNSGAILPRTEVRGHMYIVENAGGGNDLNLYPSSGNKIDGGLADAPLVIEAGKAYMLISSTLNANQAYDFISLVLGATGSGGSGVPVSRVLTAGAGLTGGGDLSADRTFNVGAHPDGSIAVNADNIQVGVLATDAQHGNLGNGALHAVVSTSVNGFMIAADKLKLDSFFSREFVTKTANYTALITDYYIGITALSATVTITLPSVSVPEKLELVIKDESGDAGLYVINVVPGGSDELDGDTGAKTINVPYGAITVVRRGGAWWMI